MGEGVRLTEKGAVRLRAVVELVKRRDEALRVYRLAETALTVWESLEETRVEAARARRG